MILALLAALGALVVAFVLYPVFTTAPAGAPAELDDSEVALSKLLDKKAMLYEAIQELDFEKAAGKVSEADYETARSDYLAQVAAVIDKIDALAPKKIKRARAPKKPPKSPTTTPLECASCGEQNPEDSKFCLECGKPLNMACPSCGEALPVKARFCNHCGAKVAS